MMPPVLDPALSLTLRGSLVLLFAASAAHKVRDAAAFRSALSGYEILPRRLTVVAAVVLIAAEIGIAVGLVLGWRSPLHVTLPTSAAAGLLLLYAVAIAVNLLRGRREIDCGCGGRAGRGALHSGLVVRNLLLAAAAVAAALPPSSRRLVWMDGFTVVAALCAATLLYGAADGLLAGAPRRPAAAHGPQTEEEAPRA